MQFKTSLDFLKAAEDIVRSPIQLIHIFLCINKTQHSDFDSRPSSLLLNNPESTFQPYEN